MSLPVSYGEVLLLFQGMDESDQEVFVVEKRGEQSDALLDVRPCCVGCLKTAKVEKSSSLSAWLHFKCSTHLLDSPPPFVLRSQRWLLISQDPPCMAAVSLHSVSVSHFGI